ncbi:MAG: hypothetical protein EBY34_05025, partial [Alphaproteobacteria bacterium]|nr:hypothetical protein [Alphaproteobacteria bacterium]
MQSQGITVRKSTSGFMSVTGLYSPTGTMSYTEVQDYANSNIKDIISRIDGVGSVTIFGPSYAMRIWLNPQKMAALNITVTDVETAL